MIKEDLIISNNIDLKLIKFKDINWYKNNLIKNINFMNFKFNNIQIFIYSYKKFQIFLKEYKFDWYWKIFNIFLNKKFYSEIYIILEIENNIENFILFYEKEIELYEKNILIMN